LGGGPHDLAETDFTDQLRNTSGLPHRPGQVRFVPPHNIDFTSTGAEAAATHIHELAALYREIYAEPPYEWGDEHVALFKQRLHTQRRQHGFTTSPKPSTTWSSNIAPRNGQR
jgi:hypothetical protein